MTKPNIEGAIRQFAGWSRSAPISHQDFFEQASVMLKRSVPFEGSCWHTLDPVNGLITGHFTDLDGSGFPFIVRNEYQQDDVGKFSHLAKGKVATTSLLDATAGDLWSSARYREIYAARGWAAELRSSFRAGRNPWGSVMLLRGKGRPNFTRDEIQVVDAVGRILAVALRTQAIGVARVSHDDADGIVIVDRRGDIQSITDDGERWLEQLGGTRGGGLPEQLSSVVALAQSEGGPAPQSAHLATEKGWVHVEATLLKPYSDGTVAILIKSLPPRRAAPLLMALHSLTEAERRVTQEVIRGLSTQQIAKELRISPYTVQDHLKSVFEKMDVRSRSELTAKVFHAGYLPSLEKGHLPQG